MIVTGPRENKRACFVPTNRRIAPLSTNRELNSNTPSVTVAVGQVSTSTGLYPAGAPVGRELSRIPVVATIGSVEFGSGMLKFLKSVPLVSSVSV